MAKAYQFKPHERPIIPGSPFNPDHPPTGCGPMARLAFSRR